MEWAIPEKNQTGGLEDIFLENPLEFLEFLLYPLEILDKTKLHA